jgi:hypothetical protein
MMDCARVIEYQIDIKQRANIYFTEFYNYTLTFDSGYYEVALPFEQNELVALRVALLEEVLYKHQEKKDDKMGEEEVQAMEAEHLNTKDNEEFPTVSDVYDQRNRTEVIELTNNDNSGSSVDIECPFCCFKAASFTSKCPNCGEEWGEMGW